jgi:pimeloyl-ACP methyl ester carboxylesterase
VTDPESAPASIEPLDVLSATGPRERWILVGGVRTRALELDGAGPPLILLHGFADSADTWRPMLRVLAARGRRALAVDLPHFGQADRPPTGNLLGLLDDFVTELSAAPRHEQRPVLVGNSLGGLLALRVGRRDGLPVAQIVGIGTPGIGKGGLLAALESRWTLIGAFAHLPLTDRIVRTFAIAFFLSARQGVHATRAQAELWARHLSVARVRQVLAVGQQLMGELAADEPLRLEDVRPPVTLVYGSRDRLCPARAAAAACHAVPGVRMIELPEAGHLTQLAFPAEIADLL